MEKQEESPLPPPLRIVHSYISFLSSFRTKALEYVQEICSSRHHKVT